MKSNMHRQPLEEGQYGSNVLLSRALHLRGEQQQTCEAGLAESTQEVAGCHFSAEHMHSVDPLTLLCSN